MLSLKLLLLASLAFVASATRYCQCENVSKGRTFSGINEVCSTLDNNWCSTKCSIIGDSCNYCQYTPVGDGDDASYQKLKDWCHKQVGRDGGQRYNGDTVFCYSYKNAIPKGFGGGGCTYQNNGDFAPSPPAPKKDPALEAYRKALEGKAVLRIVPKPELVKYRYLRQSVYCDQIYRTSGQKIREDFMAAALDTHDPLECKVYYEPNNVMECHLIDEPRIAKYVDKFNELCKDIAGHDEATERKKLEEAQKKQGT